jgi:hypothetical protein
LKVERSCHCFGAAQENSVFQKKSSAAPKQCFLRQLQRIDRASFVSMQLVANSGGVALFYRKSYDFRATALGRRGDDCDHRKPQSAGWPCFDRQFTDKRATASGWRSQLGELQTTSLANLKQCLRLATTSNP